MPNKKSQNKKDEKVMEFSWKSASYIVSGKTFDEKVDEICGRISDLLKRKNASYGNSALDPLRIFSALNPDEQIRVRIDDKLSRIKRGNDSFNEDTLLDLVGYLILLMMAKKSQ